MIQYFITFKTPNASNLIEVVAMKTNIGFVMLTVVIGPSNDLVFDIVDN